MARTTREVAYAAVFTGLVFIATTVIVVPIPATQGYFNLGESMIYLAALLLGPFVASTAGGLGSMLADLYLGYPHYAWVTFIVKGLEGFLVAVLFTVLSRSATRVFVGAATAIATAVVSMIAVAHVEGAVAYYAIFTVFIMLQLAAIALAFKNVKVAAAISACGIGGVEMVLGYFLYETFLYGYCAALVEVPVNYAQSLFGTLIALALYNPIKSLIKK